MDSQKKRLRLVLFPLPFQGHINPMIQLANILYSKGFTISIVHTRYNFPNPTNYPQFTFYLIPDGLSEIEESLQDSILIIKILNENCAESFRNCLEQLLLTNHIHCIITDAHWYSAQAVADALNLPRIVIRTTSVCSFLAFAALCELRDKGYLSNMESKMDEPVEELPPLKVKDIPTFKTSYQEEVYRGIGIMVGSFGLIFNTFKELEEPELLKLCEQFHMPTFTIGPFHKCFSAATSSLLTQDMTSITWLDKQAPNSVLYVSFGSIASMDAKKLEEVAWGLANSKQPFLWAIRPKLVHGSEWLEMLPNELLDLISKQGYIVKWAPQQEVLSHPSVGGFWTHSGWNSTLESICEGVPMICSPFFGDQMVNSRYVNDVWKIGIRLEKGIEREEIENAIRKLMVEKEGKEMKLRVMCLKKKTDVCSSTDGSSSQSLNALVDFISSFRSSAA